MKIKLAKGLAFIAAFTLVTWLLLYVNAPNIFWICAGAALAFVALLYAALPEGRKIGKTLQQNPSPTHQNNRDWGKDY